MHIYILHILTNHCKLPAGKMCRWAHGCAKSACQETGAYNDLLILPRFRQLAAEMQRDCGSGICDGHTAKEEKCRRKISTCVKSAYYDIL